MMLGIGPFGCCGTRWSDGHSATLQKQASCHGRNIVRACSFRGLALQIYVLGVLGAIIEKKKFGRYENYFIVIRLAVPSSRPPRKKV
jgi:hypothetical protein